MIPKTMSAERTGGFNRQLVNPSRTKHGVLYNPEALRTAVLRRGMSVRMLSRRCSTGDQQVKQWLDPKPGHRMQWKTMDRLRKVLNLTEEEVRAIWEVNAADEQSDG